MDLVLEGGGVKGVALVGAYSVLEERGYETESVAGASAGAIVAALIAAGYTAGELSEIVGGLDYSRFKDESWSDRLPVVGAPLSVLKDLGIYEGVRFEDWIADLLEAKGVRTFGDLMRRDGGEPRFRHKLQVIVSDVTERRLLVLPRDAAYLGLEDPDELDVAISIRMSMSIPIFFEPVRWENPKTGREHLIVDGGMLSNFPVWLFDAEEPVRPTIGLKLAEPDPRSPLTGPDGPCEPIGVLGYLRALVDTMMEAHDRFYMEERDFARTIAIDTLGVRITEFDLTAERAALLHESGRRATERFLNEG